jgi:hypothetical protein
LLSPPKGSSTTTEAVAVEVDLSGTDGRGQPQGAAEIRGPDATDEAELVSFEMVAASSSDSKSMHDRQDGPKDLLAHHAGVGLHPVPRYTGPTTQTPSYAVASARLPETRSAFCWVPLSIEQTFDMSTARSEPEDIG